MAEHGPRRAVAPPRSGGTGVAIVGVSGALLVTAAVILALFAVWQLFYTTWQVAGPRDEQITQFQLDHPPSADAENAQRIGEVHVDDPPPVVKIGHGSIYGVLHIPSWDWMKTPLAEGTTDDVLDLGYAGHYAETAQPGQVGNFSVAGHRRTYGNNFRHIDRLVPGDVVVVETAENYYVYAVDSHEIVAADDPNNVRVVAPVPGDITFSQVPTQRFMTMTTCHPEYGNTERYIVHLLMQSWTPKASGLPIELAKEPAG